MSVYTIFNVNAAILIIPESGEICPIVDKYSNCDRILSMSTSAKIYPNMGE